MLVCVDIGNTNIVTGVYNGDDLISTFRLETKLFRTEDEYGIKFMENLRYMGVTKDDIRGVIISSVVPQIDATMEKTFDKYFKIKPLFVGPGVKTGIKINIYNPKQLGADLLVGAVAATKKYGYPCLVVDMGTATTLSLVNEKKEFVGGIIYPGVITAYDSLIKATALLESAKLEIPEDIIGRDTMGSIQSGMVYGTAGAINGMVKEIFKKYGTMPVVVTGGIARHIAPYLDNVKYDENLLLEGLKFIYERNQE
jgi:type III pantothenate kinase